MMVGVQARTWKSLWFDCWQEAGLDGEQGVRQN